MNGNGVNGDTYGVVAAGFVGNEAPYINYLPEFWQDAYPAILKGEDGVWYDGFQTEETKAACVRRYLYLYLSSDICDCIAELWLFDSGRSF